MRLTLKLQLYLSGHRPVSNNLVFVTTVPAADLFFQALFKWLITPLSFMREITFKQFRKEEKMSFTRTFGAPWQQKALTRYCFMNMDTKKHFTMGPSHYRNSTILGYRENSNSSWFMRIILFRILQLILHNKPKQPVWHLVINGEGARIYKIWMRW